jgi:hypothetical protein
MMKLILGSQLGRNASAYVDDIVIMSEKRGRSHCGSDRDLRQHEAKQPQAQPREVHLRHLEGAVTGLYGL